MLCTTNRGSLYLTTSILVHIIIQIKLNVALLLNELVECVSLMQEVPQPLPPAEENLPTPQAELVIQELETLRALSDPLRLRIIECLAQPQTAKTVAAKLAIGKTKLYYHLNLLEKHGIIRVVRTRVVSGIIEKSYQVTALRFRPAKALLSSSDEGKDRSVAIIDSILDATRTDLVHGLKTGAVEIGTDAHLRKMLLGRVMMVLTPTQAASFMERLQALLEEMAQCTAPPTEGRPYALTLAFFPKSEEE